MTLVQEIRKCIEGQLDRGMRKFIVFPYGEIGMEVCNILGGGMA